MKNYTITKVACFLTTASTAIASIFSPLLFTMFHRVYGISYTLLGFLVVLNFASQLALDLTYSFFSKKLDLKVSMKLTAGVITAGIILYAFAPTLFPENPYLGLALGTVIFSAGGGLAEVLTSPVIAYIPSKNPEKTMSRLHSCYAWGLLFVIVFSSAYIVRFGTENWQTLALILAILPFTAFVLMLLSPIPDMDSQESVTGDGGVMRNKTAILYIICIFFAGASEITMCQWGSSYLETAFGIDKTVCDLLGLGAFALMLGTGRTLYAHFGKKIDNALLYGALGTAVCYFVTVFSPLPVLSIAACAMTGFFVAMLWPGSLIAVTDRVPNAGVTLFAFMAVGGDLGATVYPQIVGYITDSVIASPLFEPLAELFAVTPEILGMKLGMLFAFLAPAAATVLFAVARKNRDRDTGTIKG